MNRLQALNPETTTGRSKELFNGIQAKLGMVPNMMRTMGNSPAVLEGYLNLSGALSNGSLSSKLGRVDRIDRGRKQRLRLLSLCPCLYWGKNGEDRPRIH